MKNGAHTHRVGDGRGDRIVRLNGRQIQQVVFADTKKGKVVVFRSPLRLDKHKKRVLTRTLYGVVDVMLKGGFDSASNGGAL